MSKTFIELLEDEAELLEDRAREIRSKIVRQKIQEDEAQKIHSIIMDRVWQTCRRTWDFDCFRDQYKVEFEKYGDERHAQIRGENRKGNREDALKPRTGRLQDLTNLTLSLLALFAASCFVWVLVKKLRACRKAADRSNHAENDSDSDSERKSSADETQ